MPTHEELASSKSTGKFEYHSIPTLNEHYRSRNQAKIDKAREQMLEKAGPVQPGSTSSRQLMSNAYAQSTEQHAQQREEQEAQYLASGRALTVDSFSHVPPAIAQQRRDAILARGNERHDRIQARVNAIREAREQGQS